MATHAHRFGSLDLPRPSRAARPLLVLAALGLLLEADPPLRLAGVAAAGCFVAAAAVRAFRSRAELGRIRRTTDRLILTDAGADGSDLVRWRTTELVAPATRERLAAELDLTLRRLDRGRLPAALPLRRVAARRAEEQLRALEARLRDRRPVTARGILLLQRLLRAPDSPLYDEVREQELRRELSAVLAELEP